MAHDRTTAAAAVLASDSSSSERAFLVVYRAEAQEERTQVVPLPDGTEVLIGRMPGSQLLLDYEPVSRRHARVARRGGEIVVEDLGSRNGTYVNGHKIDSATVISTGDEIAVGPVTAIVGLTAAARRRVIIASAADFEERLSAEADRATRFDRPLGVVMIRIDGVDEGVEEAVIRLAEVLRRMDFLARYTTNEYACLLPEADHETTQQIAAGLMRELAPFGPELSLYGGFAACPDDGGEPAKLLSTARAALRRARASGPGKLVGSPKEEAAASGTVVQDPVMKRVYALAKKVAATPLTVLVLGETGVGKEVVANAVHTFSARAGKPFVTLNCSALPEALLESELFGYEKGAFTGAERRKLGYFEAAASGTIFLDEIGEMPIGVQAKLLRVLENRLVTRVGGTDPVDVDVRVVCATNRDLEEEVKRGRFRQDLFFRLSAFTVVIPPLRSRQSEIVPLANHFARQFARELGQKPPTFHAAAERRMQEYDWPGNVRELRNAVERALVLAPSGRIAVEHLPQALQAARRGTESGVTVRANSDVRIDSVVAALEASGFNQTHAAKKLGLSRFALIRLMNKYGIPRRARHR